VTSHTTLTDIGTNTHPQIDAHIAASTAPTITSFTNARHNHANAAGGDPIDHGVLTGNGDDDHNIYCLIAGRSGGQYFYGGTGAGDTIRMISTAHATKGKIYFGAAFTTVYDEVNNRFGIGTASPTQPLDVIGVVRSGQGTYGAVSLSAPGGVPGLVFLSDHSSQYRADVRRTTTDLRILTSASNSAPSSANGIVILNNGNVGINNETPTLAKLSVTSSSIPAGMFERSDSEDDITVTSPTVLIYNPSVANQYNFAQIAFAGKDETGTQRITAAISSQFYRAGSVLSGALSFQTWDGFTFNSVGYFDTDGHFNAMRRIRVQGYCNNIWYDSGSLAIKQEGADSGSPSFTYHAEDGTRFGALGMSSASLSLWHDDEATVTISTDNVDRIRIEDNGNVGIGLFDSGSPWTNTNYDAQTQLHVGRRRDGNFLGGMMFDIYEVLDGDPVEMLSGTANFSAVVHFTGMVSVSNIESAAVRQSALISVTDGTPYVMNLGGSDELTFSSFSNNLEVERTGGTKTYRVSILGTWTQV
jgi:hypothetical protein